MRRLSEVRGVVAVVLGGSRARGEHRPDSDYDYGLYYRGELDVDALRVLGFYSHAYAGELALCQVLADPTGEVSAVREQAQYYPQPLAEALVAGLWEADFMIGAARKAPLDRVYVTGCLFRAVGVMAHALHGRAGRWTVNEKASSRRRRSWRSRRPGSRRRPRRPSPIPTLRPNCWTGCGPRPADEARQGFNTRFSAIFHS
ncbi:hypothetical protein Cs7R123_13330 [Catellatospora sp. TT07R-123]|nr:hypothetical protein Cs7R123_13330 [Catellatospora sp. TT07R-123]